MNAKDLIERVTDTEDQTNLCVVLRGVGGPGLETLIVYDEQNRPSIPGGHAKDNESRIEACQREVREETGLEVEVQPLMWTDHVARKIPANVHYAIVDGGDEARPGGGDVTKVRWVPVNDLGELNGTDRLVINVAANRVHDPGGIVDDAVEMAESQGYAVATVAAPPAPVDGVYLRINGKAAPDYAKAISSWATGLGWPTVVIATAPFESTNSALERASKHRQLTPILESLLRTSDALWRYENLIGSFLKKGHTVLEVGGLDRQRLLKRGMPADLLENMIQRIPQPLTVFEVGEFNQPELQCLKDCIEQIKQPVAENVDNTDDPRTFVRHFKSDPIPPKEGARVIIKVDMPGVCDAGQTGVIAQFPYYRSGALQALVSLDEPKYYLFGDETSGAKISGDAFRIQDLDILESVDNPDDPNEFLQHFESEIEPFEGARVKIKATGQMGVIEQYPVDYPPFANDCAVVLLTSRNIALTPTVDATGPFSRREFKLSELEVLPLSANYENGVCPDCGEPIPVRAVYGDACENCEHVWNDPFGPPVQESVDDPDSAEGFMKRYRTPLPVEGAVVEILVDIENVCSKGTIGVIWHYPYGSNTDYAVVEFDSPEYDQNGYTFDLDELKITPTWRCPKCVHVSNDGSQKCPNAHA